MDRIIQGAIKETHAEGELQSENNNNKTILIAFGCHGNIRSPSPVSIVAHFIILGLKENHIPDLFFNCIWNLKHSLDHRGSG